MSDFNPEYDDEAGMADNNLETLKRAVKGIDDVIKAGDNLPEWCQEKIAVAKAMLVNVWDYMLSEQNRGINETKKSHKRPKYSIKPKSSTLSAYQPGGDKKSKKKKAGYLEHLESKLSNSLNEGQDRMAGVGMGNYVVDKNPTESSEPVSVRREQDEWVVIMKKGGKKLIKRIPADEASDREEAIKLAFGSVEELSKIEKWKYVDKGSKSLNDLANKASSADSPEDSKKFISKALRRQNNIDKVTRKLVKPSNEGWTHDSLAAQLFEQDLTYEDELNRKLNRKLKK